MREPKTGDALATYMLLADFSVGSGGNCRWTSAEREGARYFIKQFLSPKYPLDSSPGTAEGKARRRRQFLEFERYQGEKLRAIRNVASEGGRLVVPADQFRCETMWYTVSPWIDTSSMSLQEIARLSFESKLLILATVALALRALHAAHIVHGDLKPANILISPARSGQFHAFLIDFDSSYFDARPPESDLVMGDQPYYSPELLSYIQGEASGHAVTAKSDVFALGLVYCQYLSGTLPTLPAEHTYAAEAVRAGRPLHFHGDAALRPTEPLLHGMLAREPERRPSVRQVYDWIKEILSGGSGPPAPPRPPHSDGGSRIIRGPTRGHDATPPSRLRITTRRDRPGS